MIALIVIIIALAVALLFLAVSDYVLGSNDSYSPIGWVLIVLLCVVTIVTLVLFLTHSKPF